MDDNYTDSSDSSELESFEFSGFYPLEHNKVYAHEIVLTCEDEIIPARCIVPISKFRMPGEDEVVDYIISLAEKFEKYEKPIIVLEEDVNSSVELDFLGIKPNIRKNIRKKQGDIISMIRSTTPVYNKTEENEKDIYLSLHLGILLEEDLESLFNNGDWNYTNYLKMMKNPNLIKKGIGERLRVELLIRDNCLPEREEIEVLIKHRTYDSQSLIINPKNYSGEIVNDLLDFVYYNFFNPEIIKKLDDSSFEKLIKYSYFPINYLLKANM